MFNVNVVWDKLWEDVDKCLSKIKLISLLMLIFVFSFLFFPSYSFLTKDEDRKYFAIIQSKYEWMDKDKIYSHIIREARANNIRVSYAVAVIVAESNGNPNAVSKSGAIGLGQSMPCHLPKHFNGNTNELKNIMLNIHVCMKYLRQCLDHAEGNEIIASIYYNYGIYSNASNARYLKQIYKTNKELVQLGCNI